MRVAREAAGPEGQAVLQQWLAHTTAPGLPCDDRRRLDLVVYGAAPRGYGLPSHPGKATMHKGAADTNGAALSVPKRRKQLASVSLPRTHARRASTACRARLGGWRPLECRGPALLARPAPGRCDRAGPVCCCLSGLVSSLVGLAERGIAWRCSSRFRVLR